MRIVFADHMQDGRWMLKTHRWAVARIDSEEETTYSMSVLERLRFELFSRFSFLCFLSFLSFFSFFAAPFTCAAAFL